MKPRDMWIHAKNGECKVVFEKPESSKLNWIHVREVLQAAETTPLYKWAPYDKIDIKCPHCKESFWFVKDEPVVEFESIDDKIEGTIRRQVIDWLQWGDTFDHDLSGHALRMLCGLEAAKGKK